MIIGGQNEVTVAVLEAMEKTPDPRLREIMLSLIKHLHGFIREAQLSEEEFQQACNFIVRLGQKSDRLAQRSGADGRLARRVVARLSAQQRQQGTDRNLGLDARSVLAAEFAAHREWRLDRALADAGAGSVREWSCAGRQGPADRGSDRGRVAILAGGPVRKSGRQPGRDEFARPIHHRRARQVLVPQRQAGRLSDPGGRPGRRFHSRREPAAQLSPRARAFPDLQAEFQDHDLADLCQRRPTAGDRRAVRRHQGADRKLCAA